MTRPGGAEPDPHADQDERGGGGGYGAAPLLPGAARADGEAAALGGVALLLRTTGQNLEELLDRPTTDDPAAPGGGTAR
uniref:Uncharacterized protein n=1 Tax=Streptomyces sp. NBC_01401 TaxID=2903854 RepID=A0AAU3H687_9ACTN